MKAALEDCRFKVTLLENANQRAMEDAIRGFGDQLQDGAVGLVYYAGHGLQVRGENYLIPIGARLEREEDVPYRAVNVGLVLDRMDRAGNSLNILILDACRNNPFGPNWHRGGAGQGLASVSAPRGSLISYATAAGRVAADGARDHSAYTGALLEELQEPGLRVEEVFKRVREKVLAASGGQQLPFESTSLVGDFYFRPPRGVEALPGDEAAPVETAQPHRPQRAPPEREGGAQLNKAWQAWERLQAQRENLLRRLGDQQAQALAGLDRDHAALRQRLEAPQDEFETAAEYQARKLDADRLKARMPQARAALEARGAERDREEVKPLDDAIAALERRRIPVTYPVSLGTYDADLGRFRVSMALGDGRSIQADLALDPARARALKGRREPLKAEGFTTLKTGPACLERIHDPVFGSLPLTGVRMTLEVGQGCALELMAIRPGTFMMGEPGRQHEVTLTHAFWLGQGPITQAQWEAVMGTRPSYFKGDLLPVENVSWEDCQQFLARLNAQGLGTFRLPTEAEWEYACRAGGAGEPQGDPGARAWHAGNSAGTTHPVGQKQPNAFGLHDMNGNVWQWCQDWGGAYPGGPETDPQGPPSGPGRVNRGGSWHDPAVPAHARDWNGPDLRCGNVGFRVLLPCP